MPEPLKLEPCPCCAGECRVYALGITGEHINIRCSRCLFQGPIGKPRIDAIDAHNTLARLVALGRAVEGMANQNDGLSLVHFKRGIPGVDKWAFSWSYSIDGRNVYATPMEALTAAGIGVTK